MKTIIVRADKMFDVFKDGSYLYYPISIDTLHQIISISQEIQKPWHHITINGCKFHRRFKSEYFDDSSNYQYDLFYVSTYSALASSRKECQIVDNVEIHIADICFWVTINMDGFLFSSDCIQFVNLKELITN